MATLVTRSGKGSPLTHAEVDANFTNLNTDKLELSGGTMTGNLSFGDNDKAIFGAGSDLQIYHQTTGTTGSFISDVGAGNLFIEANNLRIRDTSENLYIFGNSGAEVQLYYDGTKKLDTTSTGIDVTGTVTADGLTVDGNGSLLTLDNGSNPATLSNTNGNVTLDFDTTNAGRNYIIQGNNVNVFKASNGGDISFYEDTGTTPKFFWDASAESLGIGTTSPASYGDLTLYKSGTNDTKLALANNGNGGGTVAWTLKNDTAWDLTLSHNAGIGGQNLIFGTKTSGGESMRIDSSGNVGIGTSSPSYALDVEDSGGGFIKASFVSTGSTHSSITFDNTGSSANSVRVGSQNNDFYVRTSGTERMRIDSSGNLLVGTTNTTPHNLTSGGGLSVRGSINLFSIARQDNEVMIVNRTGTDGDIALFRKNGSTVGSIGTNGGNLFVASVDTGLQYNGVADQIRPCNGSGAARDAAIDLGDSTRRFKDLYLSGGVYLGGTGSANKLDDYEEGTFTASAEFSGGNPTSGASTATGYYTKIGNRVLVEIQFANINVSGASGQCKITGLPFNLANNGTLAIGGIRMRSVTFIDQVICLGIPNTNRILLEDNQGSVFNAGIEASDCSDGNTDIAISINYTV